MDMESQKQGYAGGGRSPGGLEREGRRGIRGRSEVWAVAGGELEKRRAGRLKRRDRELVALLGMCRYLTAKQVVELGQGARTEKVAGYRLRGLAGEATSSKVRGFEPALLRPLRFRGFDGEPFQLWALTPAGYAVAGAELGRLLRVPRVDVGATFAEHSAFLTDVFVQLARPFLQAGIPPRHFPFRWDVAEDVELPWREKGAGGAEKSRVIRPDAVLEVPTARRRFFIECEMGTHTLTPVSPEKVQATVRKVERYDAYVSGFEDARSRVSHYQRKYPDGWPCDVLFLVQKARRQAATSQALATAREKHGTRVPARAFTLQEMVAYCGALFPSPSRSLPREATAFTARCGPAPGQFYGEREHRTVNDFILEMTAALTTANSALRRNGFTPVAEPSSKAAMLDFLRKAQVELHRQRASEAPHA